MPVNEALQWFARKFDPRALLPLDALVISEQLVQYFCIVEVCYHFKACSEGLHHLNWYSSLEGIRCSGPVKEICSWRGDEPVRGKGWNSMISSCVNASTGLCFVYSLHPCQTDCLCSCSVCAVEIGSNASLSLRFFDSIIRINYYNVGYTSNSD